MLWIPRTYQIKRSQFKIFLKLSYSVIPCLCYISLSLSRLLHPVLSAFSYSQMFCFAILELDLLQQPFLMLFLTLWRPIIISCQFHTILLSQVSCFAIPINFRNFPSILFIYSPFITFSNSHCKPTSLWT